MEALGVHGTQAVIAPRAPGKQAAQVARRVKPLESPKISLKDARKVLSSVQYVTSMKTKTKITLLELADNYVDGLFSKKTDSTLPKVFKEIAQAGGVSPQGVRHVQTRTPQSLSRFVGLDAAGAAHVFAILTIYILTLVAIKAHELGSEFLNPGINSCLRRQSTPFSFFINTIMNNLGSSCPSTIDKQHKLDMALFALILTALAGQPNITTGTFTVSMRNIFANLYNAYHFLFVAAYNRMGVGQMEHQFLQPLQAPAAAAPIGSPPKTSSAAAEDEEEAHATTSGGKRQTRKRY